jgi:hypothetical protein
MAVILDQWTPEQARKILTRRLSTARSVKRDLERQWDRNEETVYRSDPAADGNDWTDGTDAVDSPTDSRSGTSYSFKNFRFIHAQMSSNPPTCVPRPSTSDPEDRRAARAADRVMKFALRRYQLQEKVDQTSLHTLLYGTGCLKVWWDTTKGDILKVRKDGSLVLEGDISTRTVSPRDLAVDPDALFVDEIRFVWERIRLTREEALHRFPDKKTLIEDRIAKLDASVESFGDSGIAYGIGHDRAVVQHETIEAWEYWETGMPANGFLGRYAVMLEDGEFLCEPEPSPHAFRPRPTPKERMSKREGRRVRRQPARARLPHHFMTDIDVPDQVWGKSFVEYEAPLQDQLNQIDTIMLANLQAHCVARIIAPDDAEVRTQFTNSPWDIVTYKARSGKPEYMAPMQLPAAMPALRTQTQQGIDAMAGVNDAVFGESNRETSGFQMQYAANQANLIRRRLFNKYVLFVESIYRTILDIVVAKWTDERVIEVLGNEKRFELLDIRGADIDGGFDLVVEYGTSLSLDPMTRRDEILKLQPLLEKAGLPPRVLLGMLKLGETEAIADMVQLAEDRQREVIERMILTGEYIAPGEFEDHANMLAYLLIFRMTADFTALEPDQQRLVIQHIKDRKAAAARELAPPAPPVGVDPAAAVPAVAAQATPAGAGAA